jgi:hypothetical protein
VVEEEEDFRVVEEVEVETEEAGFREGGIKVVVVATRIEVAATLVVMMTEAVEVVIKTEVVAIKLKVEDMEGVTRIEGVVMEVATRIEEVVVVMAGATRIEGVGEGGVVVAEGETITIDVFNCLFPSFICDSL